MSLEKIDQYMRELEAIKNYDEAKKERAEALSRIDELEEAHEVERDELLQANTKLEGRLDKLLEEKKDLKNRLGEKEKEIESLRGAFKVRDEESRRIKLKANVLKNRVGELEELKGALEGKTLGEAEKVFLEAKKEEVRRKADERFNSMKAEWVKSEKPNEVFNNAVKWLQHIIENLGKPGPRIFLKKLADLGLPAKVEGLIKSEVDKRLDTEFERKVEEESSRKASVKLEQMVSTDWPNWLNANLEPRARELEAKIITNAFALLKGPWYITCDRCGTEQSVELTSQGIEELLRSRYVNVECMNPNCTNWGRHKINVALEVLIYNFIGGGYER